MCGRWFLVAALGALMAARPCNLLPQPEDDDLTDVGDGSFWSQRSYGRYVDDFLVKLRHAVVDDGLDPLEPPDEVQDIDERSGLSTWHADVRLEPRDMRALRKDSDAFVVSQREAKLEEQEQELSDLILSYMFLGRVMKLAPSGDIFGQVKELQDSVQQYVEKVLRELNLGSHAQAGRFIQIRNRQRLKQSLELVTGGFQSAWRRRRRLSGPR